jgi:hypothetical protein
MSANRKSERPLARWDRDHLEQLLDQALADSFPASDPVAIDFGTPAHNHATNTEAGPQPVPRTQSHSWRRAKPRALHATRGNLLVSPAHTCSLRRRSVYAA